MRKKFWLVIFFSCFFSIVSMVRAQDVGYYTDLNATYDFNAFDEKAKVKLDFKLTNASATTFVESYQITVPEAGVSALVFQPKEEKVEKKIASVNGQQQLDLNFTNEVVGQGKSRAFGVEYDDTNLIKIRGKNRLITIPALANAGSYRSYRTQVTIPTSFGEAVSLTPTPTKTDQLAGEVVYTFDQSDGQPIKLQYGQEQYLQFELRIPLENKSNAPVYRQITLPNNKADLEINYVSLQPQLDSWQIAANGDWLGFYLLQPGESIEFLAQGFLTASQTETDFAIANYFPTLVPYFWAVNIEQIPDEYVTASPQAALNLDLSRIGALPLPGQYEVEITNLTGYNWTNLTLEVTEKNQAVTLWPETQTINLLPWQTTTVTVHTRPKTWWHFYEQSQLELVVKDQNGTTISTTSYQEISLAYLTLAIAAGVLAAAVTGGSILVARRK